MEQVITIVEGDITRQAMDAIVNAANSSLLGGGGVDGAIHRVGGPAILEECRLLRRTTYPEGLPTGDAVATTAGRLPAKRVIHTVGPIWSGGGNGEEELLLRAYTSCLTIAHSEGLRTIAFPSISTGAYGYPIELAAPVALRAFADPRWSDSFDEIRMVLFSHAYADVFRRAYTPSL